MKVTKLEFTNVFADDTNLKVNVTDINPDNLNVTNIQTQVKAFNEASGGTLADKMKSKNGFNWIGIKRVRVITTDTEYIF